MCDSQVHFNRTYDFHRHVRIKRSYAFPKQFPQCNFYRRENDSPTCHVDIFEVINCYISLLVLVVPSLNFSLSLSLS